MGCPTTCVINDNLVFSVATHDPETGVLTDATTPPTYSIYEEEVLLISGAMGKVGPVITGFYIESIAVTTGNGFEAGKNYTICIEATVGGDVGGLTFAFKVVASPATYAQVETVDSKLPNALPGEAGGVFIAGSNAATTVNITGTVSGNSTAAALTTLSTLVGKLAPLLVGTVTGAGTGTEVYTYNGVTVTVTVDADGNVSNVAFS